MNGRNKWFYFHNSSIKVIHVILTDFDVDKSIEKKTHLLLCKRWNKTRLLGIAEKGKKVTVFQTQTVPVTYI